MILLITFPFLELTLRIQCILMYEIGLQSLYVMSMASGQQWAISSSSFTESKVIHGFLTARCLGPPTPCCSGVDSDSK